MPESIAILGFGCGDKGEITLRTLEILRNSDAVFVRTTHHPAAEILEEYHIPYRSFDDCYDQADNFDDVYRTIADTVLSCAASKVAYIVPGSPVFAERAVQIIRREATCEVRLIPAVSFLDGIFSAIGQDAGASFKLIDALDAAQKPDPSTTTVVCQVYDRSVASDTKLSMMDYYPDAHPVMLITAAGTAQEQVERIALYEIDRIDHIDHLTTLVIPPSEERFYGFDGLAEIVKTLRSEDGCSWDKAQTHESLIKYMIEESYEAIDAIKRQDDENLCEELGDVLLQVLLHAQIAEEEQSFTIRDVIRTVSEKMVRRHPHVFSDTDGTVDLNAQWEQIKSEEKQYASVSEKMAQVAKSLPALIYAQKIQSIAAKAGFDFSGANEAFSKIREETDELEEVLSSGDRHTISEEGGDLLFAVTNVLRLSKVASEESLYLSGEKFLRRFTALEGLIRADGLEMSAMSAEKLDYYWNLCKKT